MEETGVDQQDVINLRKLLKPVVGMDLPDDQLTRMIKAGWITPQTLASLESAGDLMKKPIVLPEGTAKCIFKHFTAITAAPGLSGLAGPALMLAFQQLVIKGGKGRPKEKILNKIQRYFPVSLLTCGNPQAAVELYERAERVPETVTRKDIATAQDVLVDGIFGPPNECSSTFLYAYHQGKIKLLKIPVDKTSTENELSVWNGLAIGKDPDGLCIRHNLVGPLVDVPIASRHEAPEKKLVGILMPLYPATLDQVASPMPERDVLRAGKEIHGALTFMHDKGYGHNDVKPSNVLLSTEGACRLGDYGSAAAIGKPIISSTHVFRASDAGSVTAPQFDFKMLAATLLYKLDLHSAESAPNVSQMSALAQHVVLDDLKAFLLTLLA